MIIMRPLMVAAFGFILATTSSLAISRTVPANLPEMVKLSSAIVRGKVQSISDTGGKTGTGASIMLARFSVSDSIKANVGTEVDVIFLRGISTSPDFRKGDEYILFLGETPFGYATTRGYRGAVRLDGNRFYTGGIEGEPEFQAPSEFLMKLKSVLQER